MFIKAFSLLFLYYFGCLHQYTIGSTMTRTTTKTIITAKVVQAYHFFTNHQIETTQLVNQHHSWTELAHSILPQTSFPRFSNAIFAHHILLSVFSLSLSKSGTHITKSFPPRLRIRSIGRHAKPHVLCMRNSSIPEPLTSIQSLVLESYHLQ